MVNYSHAPSQIGVSDYSLFKDGITPAWEDPSVCKGGRWVIKLSNKARTVDDVWLAVVMAMIGENIDIEYGHAICGAVVAVRPRSLKLALWISVRAQAEVCSIGRNFQRIVAEQLEAKDRTAVDATFQVLYLGMYILVICQSFKDEIEFNLPGGVNISSEPIRQPDEMPRAEQGGKSILKWSQVSRVFGNSSNSPESTNIINDQTAKQRTVT